MNKTRVFIYNRPMKKNKSGTKKRMSSKGEEAGPHTHTRENDNVNLNVKPKCATLSLDKAVHAHTQNHIEPAAKLAHWHTVNISPQAFTWRGRSQNTHTQSTHTAVGIRTK